MGSISSDSKPHAVCMPYPAQGHITPMLTVAKLLHSSGFYITFVNTEYNHRRLLRSLDQIMSKEIDISYRILAHLQVGIVRIFSKKVEFLEEDCSKTLKTLTESVEAIYWKNPKKSEHVQKQTSHLPETSGGGTHSGMGLLKALRASSAQVVISVPATFELNLFDLEIADDWYGAFSCTV